jgi:hypothetical protein
MRPQLVEWQSWCLPAAIKERGLFKDLSPEEGLGAVLGTSRCRTFSVHLVGARNRRSQGDSNRAAKDPSFEPASRRTLSARSKLKTWRK